LRTVLLFFLPNIFIFTRSSTSIYARNNLLSLAKFTWECRTAKTLLLIIHLFPSLFVRYLPTRLLSW